MDLEKLDAIERATFELAKDLLDTRNRYQPHDPDLAAAFSSKAYEICRDFGIDRALIESTVDNQHGDMSAESTPRVTAVELPDPDAEDGTSDQTLHEILDKQRKVVGDQFRETTQEAKNEQTTRMSRLSMSQWFSRLQSA